MNHISVENISDASPFKSAVALKNKYSGGKLLQSVINFNKFKNQNHLKNKYKLIQAKEPISKFYSEYTILKKPKEKSNNSNISQIKNDYFKQNIRNKSTDRDNNLISNNQTFQQNSKQISHLWLAKIKDFKNNLKLLYTWIKQKEKTK